MPLAGVSEQDEAVWTGIADKLGITDFDVTTVNWNLPVQWKSTDSGGGVLMSLPAGILMCVLFGVFFSVITVGLTYLETKFGGVAITSEHFNTAGRDVKTGLTAAVIVSQWTWAATLLQSSNVAWSFGLSGPFWYAAGASVQVLLFGILAIEIKRKSPNAHTFLEMVDVRWGKCAHLTFLYFGLMTNAIVSAMLLLGGAAVMKEAANVPVWLYGILVPLGTLCYTLVGGLKATFLASYLHTAIIFVGLVMMIFAVYIVPGDCTDTTKQCNSLGSASIVYERLQFFVNLPKNKNRFEGNAGNSLLTMVSVDGIMFGIINTVGNFGTVFVDQSYWQSAIAAHPSSAVKGYMYGGLVWFTIPFALATSLGLAANALNVDLTGVDAGNGLVPPAAAYVLVGPFGGWLILIMLFMAITSTGSAEMIAVSSLLTYDVYRKYINPNATGARILKVSRIMVVVWAFVMFLLNIILWQIGEATDGKIGLGWVYNFMGIMIGSAVIPVSFLLLWSRTPAIGAIAGAFTGNICALIVWIVHAANTCESNGYCGVSASTLGTLEPQLSGNLTAILSSGLICTLFSLFKPQNYDWEKLNAGIKLVENASVLGSDALSSSPEYLTAAKKWIVKYGIGGTIVILLLWPLCVMPWGVFSKPVFQIWSSIVIGWGVLAATYIIIAPLAENTKTIMAVLTCSPVSTGSSAILSSKKTVPETASA